MVTRKHGTKKTSSRKKVKPQYLVRLSRTGHQLAVLNRVRFGPRSRAEIVHSMPEGKEHYTRIILKTFVAEGLIKANPPKKGGLLSETTYEATAAGRQIYDEAMEDIRPLMPHDQAAPQVLRGSHFK